MKPAVLPVAALAVAMSTLFLPPVLSLAGLVPQPKAPRPLLIVHSEAMPVAPVASSKSIPTKVQPVRIPPEPVDPQSPIPQFTRLASAEAPALR